MPAPGRRAAACRRRARSRAIGPLREPDELQLLVDDGLAGRRGLRRAARARGRRCRGPCATASRPNCWNTMATRSRRTRRSCAVSHVATSTSESPSRMRTWPRVTAIQPVRGAQQGRFAGPGQSHEHGDLAARDAQGSRRRRRRPRRIGSECRRGWHRRRAPRERRASRCGPARPGWRANRMSTC